ncbi:hypothetical protein E4Q23_13310 [Candidatus Accumulibacter phosphatis]|jgi:formamidopyrimidine-DNA glycosylase|uniref:Inhibitor I9 domain-containing protein n=1 Tax=Candidatus Accumulibacter phosphatis TaxID=327160 RepID=A0ABX1TWI8_9PROT|nr:hypothetical protein [Candidatus Accumulibacter phosphatis]NMQ28646.1 hypothetical protein [Candidatus Accumulibacter phosphatis]
MMSSDKQYASCRGGRAKAIIVLFAHLLVFTPTPTCGGEAANGKGRTGGHMKIETSLADELRANRDDSRKFSVIVSFKDSASVELLRHLGVEPTAVYQSIAAAAAAVTAAQIATLAAAGNVTSIELDQPAAALGPR